METKIDPSKDKCLLYSNDITVLTVTYGQTELVDYMTKSLFKQMGFPLPVVVVNNLETHVPSHDEEFFTEIDNNKSKLTATTKELADLASREPSNNHAMAISYGLKNCVKTRWCLLADNDVLFKPTIKYLLNSPCVENLIGEIGCDKIVCNRVFPYMCVIDMDRLNSDGIEYFDPKRPAAKEPRRDTGASFLEDVCERGWMVKHVNLDHFVVHLKGATFRHKDWRKWLNENKRLY